MSASEIQVLSLDAAPEQVIDETPDDDAIDAHHIALADTNEIVGRLEAKLAAGITLTADEQDELRRNREHMIEMGGKPFWGDRDVKVKSRAEAKSNQVFAKGERNKRKDARDAAEQGQGKAKGRKK